MTMTSVMANGIKHKDSASLHDVVTVFDNDQIDKRDCSKSIE